MSTPVEFEIRQLIAEKEAAICARDVDAIMAHYAPDVVCFDVKPPDQIRGAAALRKVWEECLPSFPSDFNIETENLKVSASEDVAVAHFLFRFSSSAKNHPATQCNLRATVVYDRQAVGRWQIIHEHGSLPFNPQRASAS